MPSLNPISLNASPAVPATAPLAGRLLKSTVQNITNSNGSSFFASVGAGLSQALHSVKNAVVYAAKKSFGYLQTAWVALKLSYLAHPRLFQVGIGGFILGGAVVSLISSLSKGPSAPPHFPTQLEQTAGVAALEEEVEVPASSLPTKTRGGVLPSEPLTMGSSSFARPTSADSLEEQFDQRRSATGNQESDRRSEVFRAREKMRTATANSGSQQRRSNQPLLSETATARPASRPIANS